MAIVRAHVRIMLMTFCLGVAAVPFSETLPRMESDFRTPAAIPIIVSANKPPSLQQYYCDGTADRATHDACQRDLVFDQRNPSAYEDGGVYEMRPSDPAFAPTESQRSIESARRFIWEHWKKRKQGYVEIRYSSRNGPRAIHLFIERSTSGSWHVLVRSTPMAIKSDSREPELGELVNVVWSKATTEDASEGLAINERYLRLCNATGDCLLV